MTEKEVMDSLRNKLGGMNALIRADKDLQSKELSDRNTEPVDNTEADG